MKINLGCGGDHKKEYLNVDGFDDTTADKIMSASNLELDDNSVEEIILSQVIEHFGIVQSIYAFSEDVLVLESGGKLVIETPDIRKSFKIYIAGEREDRKNILPWIYGVDIPGMQHRFCFPDDLLEEELSKIGFVNIEKSYRGFDEYEPILKVVCEKPMDYEIPQFFTAVRGKLLECGEIHIDQQIISLEKESLVESFFNDLKKFYEKKDDEILEKMLIDGAVQSPRVTCIFFEILLEKNLLSKYIGMKYIQILKILDSFCFLDILLDKLSDFEGYVGKQEEVFDEIHNVGKETIKKLLSASEKDRENIIKTLHENRTTNVEYEIDFLSEKLVMLKANRFFQRGVKEFNNSNFEEAVNYFKKSSLLYRDQILTYWNLGRLHMLLCDEDIAKSYYESCLQLLKMIRYDKEEQIRGLLEQEMNKNTISNYEKSLISLRQIYEISDSE